MPAGRNLKNPKKKASTRAGASQLLCDGCYSAISQSEALKCLVCSAHLHRYCAGIPLRHFESISASFICTACSLTASKTVVAELRDEISALKAELSELKSALAEEKRTSSSLATEIASLRCHGETSQVSTNPERSYASAAKRGTQSGNRAPRRRPKQAHPRAHTGNAVASSQDSIAAGGRTDSDQVNASAPREMVRGARRVWGTMRSATCTTVKNTLSRLTSVNSLQVKRKFNQSTRSGKDKWWFIVRGSEEVMQSLENAWEPVKLQTGWQLEQCTKPITPAPTSTNTLPATNPNPITEETPATSPQDPQNSSDPNSSEHVPFLEEPQASTQSPPSQ